MSTEKDLAKKVLTTVQSGLIKKYKPFLIGGLALLLILAGGYFLRSCKQAEPAQPVTYTSQEKAETPAGVTQAADAAKVPISQEQAQEAAVAIKDSANKKPDKVINTTGADLQTAAATALKDSGGDFAMITSPSHPELTPAVLNPSDDQNESASGTQATGLEAIKPADPIVLNQYNIQAYPKHLTVAHVGTYTAGVERLNKVNIGSIPLFLPKGGVGYVGPYVGVTHTRFEKIDHVDFGIAVAF